MDDEACEERTWNTFALAIGRFCLDISIQNDTSSEVLACIVEPGKEWCAGSMMLQYTTFDLVYNRIQIESLQLRVRDLQEQLQKERSNSEHYRKRMEHYKSEAIKLETILQDASFQNNLSIIKESDQDEFS